MIAQPIMVSSASLARLLWLAPNPKMVLFAFGEFWREKFLA
jgi:hypothetical protein